MRDQLIGYLLDALEPSEHQQVEAQLSRDPQLKRDLELISRGLRPLAADRAHCEPPPGLAERTCVHVVQRSQSVTLPGATSGPVQRQWSMADMVVAAGIFLAAALLFFPAVNQSRFAARVTQCQNKLRQVGIAMNDYSIAHNGFFPHVPLKGQFAAVGVIAVRLRDLGYLEDSHLVVCPASSLADEDADFRIPTLAELRAARGTALARLQRRMAGSFGFNLGYVADGHYFPSKNLHRARYALVADTPNTQSPYYSPNHGGRGQNVLFEDQHVQYLTTCRAHGCRDDIYTNDDGQVRPGLHLHDAVLGPSQATPRLGTVVLKIRGVDPE